jgi:peptidyl-prolyl cis-trans isomerase SurA
VLSRQVLERLVLVKLQVARAQGSGIRVSDQELNQAMNSIAQQNGSNLDALRQRLAHDGIDFNDFRASVRDEITVQRLRQSFAQSRISVSEGEVDAALKQQATVGNQYHLAHILIALPDGANADQIATGQKKADGVKTCWTRASWTSTPPPCAIRTAPMRWKAATWAGAAWMKSRRPSQMMEKMKPGEVVGPIRGPSGFQLLKLVEVRDASSAAAGAHTVTEYHGRHILVRVDDHQTDAAASQDRHPACPHRRWCDFQTVAKESSRTTTARARAAIWAGSRPTRSVRPSASRWKASRTVASASRSVPMPVGTSCSAWPPARPT